MRAGAWENRAFLVRAEQYLVTEAGIRQFLDIGPVGPPTANNVHEAAQAIAPETRVVYVDNDRQVLTQALPIRCKIRPDLIRRVSTTRACSDGQGYFLLAVVPAGGKGPA